MTTGPKERRGRAIKRPPSRIGRLLVALRESVGRRVLDSNADPAFIKKARTLKHAGISRREAVIWVYEITGYQVNEEDIRRAEVGSQIKSPEKLLKWLLTAYGLTTEEVSEILSDANLNSIGGANPHLLASWRMRNLAFGEFGPTIHDAFRVGDYVSTWVESEKASSGGFKATEIITHIEADEADKPPLFEKLASDALAQNELRKQKGIRGWSDNKTLCLAAITDHIADDEEERRSISLHFQQSHYRYNVIAKQEAGAEFRWRALQESRFPIQPVPYLASGVGICINVICDDGKSIIVGQRSNDETFRKGEFDIAVVEGIRPSGDVVNGNIDITSVAHRALSEELGLNKAVKDKSVEELIERLVIFEFGCDLEFYQWNFLAFAEVKLDFETIYSAWQKAKDRKENQTLRKIPFNRDEVERFVQERAIWSAGMACALRSFDYY